VRSYVIESLGVGGNYTAREPGHWLVDARQANPMSTYLTDRSPTGCRRCRRRHPAGDRVR
jgi:hypothetical protein